MAQDRLGLSILRHSEPSLMALSALPSMNFPVAAYELICYPAIAMKDKTILPIEWQTAEQFINILRKL